MSTPPPSPAPETGGSFTIRAGEVSLAAHLARPAPSAAGGAGRHGLVLCHGFPVEPTDPGTRTGATTSSPTGWLPTPAGWC